ncbi:DUF11 domain-containing protein [Frondihabitans australicus]|uniref:Putative repeat protein (TIGR01451 family)/fimbrial isopeptide formation D2 family protein n=1 Tax=Frondihabitans australicus TaxID=386892 RepID=A0A495IK78_9MICO|nr:DUF11 domain-containing protein [Frondihabitans australicus]RKR76384.1 putative repeat protein (TIGR01451 family)/fimbrial isopeptide formation D2 family protein [Frondihabitans australicus]
MSFLTRRPSENRQRRPLLGVIAAIAVAFVVGGTAFAAPAAAADTGALTLSKTVDQGQSGSYAPGDEFTYQIAVGCDDNDCQNAVMTDPLPAAFAGFTIESTTTSPSANPSTQSYSGCTTTVTANCTLTVAYREALGTGVVGISAGDTYTTSITLRVPANLPPTWPSNGQAITNTANATSTTATPATDQAQVTVNIPITVGTTLGKTWAPATQQFAPGAASTITLMPRNTSNVPAETLLTQDPTSAQNGATSLGSDDPFALVDFTGFGPVTLPDGATTVQVDAYVFNDALGAYEWVPGQPNAPGAIALPAGVDPSAVAGLRFTFAGADGAQLTGAGAAGSVAVSVAQRATNRQTGASLVAGGSLTNQATSTVTVPGQAPATASAQAPYTITPLSTAVTATKSISPAKIPAGTTATATIGGKNTSNGPLDSLSLSDTDYFTPSIAFGGFSAGVSYPTGATAGRVTWHFGDGTTTTVPFGSGTTPATPTAPAGSYVSGFSLDFTGAVAVNATATAQYLIAPVADTVAQADGSVATTNTVDVTGANAAGPSSAAASAPLQIYYPQIQLGLAKTISPQAPVAPGGTVVAQLPATTDPSTAYVNPDTIVVTDVARPGQANDFWNSFQPTAIAPTQVPRGSTLLVEYSTDDGATWQTLTTADATAATQVFRYDIDPALQPSITGLRYTFSNPQGFAQGVTVSPNTVFQAQANLRDGTGPTSVAGAAASSYQNHATAVGTGEVTGLPDLRSAVVAADANARIQTFTGEGTLLASKAWTNTSFSRDITTLDAQSGEQAGTKLGWGVNSTGYSSLTVTDSASNQQDPSQTVFQAFNLVRVAPVSFTADPLMQWDQVTTLELYENGAWVTVTPPTGSWMSSTGFAGYTLTSAQQAATTGIRITVTPNDPARAASTNPLAPPVGSGIATSAGNQPRFFDLVWQLRNTVRVANGAGPWVTATHGYNEPDAATIDNTVGVAGTQNGAAVGPRVADDTITLIDQPPLVAVTKASQKSSIVVPQPGDVPAAGYPTNDFTVKVQNDSASRASYLRATEPMPCDAGSTAACKTDASGFAANPYATAVYSPSTNPFERFTITGLVFAGVTPQISTTASTVTLWHYGDAGALTTSTVTLAQAQTLTAAQLADVVGVSALYQGATPTTTGGTITNTAPITMTLHTQVRQTLRSDPVAFVTPFSVDNYAFAQSYDPVLFPSGAQSTPTDVSHATVALIQGKLDVTASKSFSPTTLLEANHTAPVAVTLGATQGTAASVAASQVTITDTDPAFWQSFRLASLSASDVTLPAGAGEVRVDVQTNGSATWQLGAFGPSAVLPSVDPATVTGIRFVFDRADHALLSNTAPPAAWSAKAVLHVTVLDDLRGTTTPVPYPSTVSDTIQTASHRYADSDLYPDANAAATASFFLDPGTFRLDVAKDPQNDTHTVVVGDTIPWTLRFTNTGTGYLTVQNLVDTLPASMEWDGNTPTYQDSAGGLLPTSGVSVAFDQTANALTFTWPSGEQRLAPGEAFTVTLGLILQPGLTSGQHSTNQMVVTTAQSLAACTNTSGNGQGTVSGLPSTECGTTNYVTPQPGPALYTSKGVKGDVTDALPTISGAVNVNSPATPCVTDRLGYYRYPCVANTQVGGTDQWRLAAANSGTVPYRALTLVDPLPTRGDRLLATGSSRGSTFRPVFDVAYGMNITAPAGTTITWQVTTTPNVCVGTGATSSWTTNPTCTGATWVDGADYTGDGTDVTGLRVILDFTTTATGTLAPGGRVQALFQTIDQPQTAQDPTGAPTTAPVGAELAWNQFGAVATTTTRAAIAPRAPVKAGVTLAGGSLTITKTIDGPAAADAPTSFSADVACTVAGQPVDLGGQSPVTLDAADLYTATIQGIPLGAACSTTEAGDSGSYGEAARSVFPGVVQILSPAGSDGSTPAGQAVVLTNTYDFGQLELDKTAESRTVRIGDAITYDITVSNPGTLPASDFSVSDDLPSNATFVSADGGGTFDSGIVTWPIASLAPGDSTVVHVTLTYDSSGLVTNQAVVTPPAGPTPWAPTETVDPCSTATGAPADASCSTVQVTPPAVTPPGGGGQGTGHGGNPPGGGSGTGPGTIPGGGSGSNAGAGADPGTTALSGALAFTGSNAGWLLALGLALLAGGVFVLGLARRKRRNTTT